MGITYPSTWKQKEGKNYATATSPKADIERLVEVGVLRELPDFHAKTYYPPEIMVAAYGSSEELENG